MEGQDREKGRARREKARDKERRQKQDKPK